MNSTPPCIDLKLEGSIARITFNNPAARNALTWPMYEKLKQICDDLANKPEIRVAIFRGAGDKAFVSGSDIQQFVGLKTNEAYEVSVDAISKNEKFAAISVLDDIYNISTYIAKDSVLASLIHQINVTPDKELELYPSIGNHKIVFGDAKDFEEKFEKLKTFYTEGLNKTDGWNKYSTINIKYKNQVVCTKK